MKTVYKGKEIPLKAGDVVLFRNEFIWYKPITILSWIIRKITGCPYNHCGTVVECNGDLFINEALASGIVCRNVEEYLERKKTFILVLRPYQSSKTELNIDFSRRAMKIAGTKYDFTALIWHQLIYRLPRLLGLKLQIWVGSTGEHAMGKMVCSEYCGWTHDLPKWWLLSSQELLDDPYFGVIYEEKPLSQRKLVIL